jgi:hypothetical protein
MAARQLGMEQKAQELEKVFMQYYQNMQGMG